MAEASFPATQAPGTCTVAPCYEYATPGYGSDATTWRSTKAAACSIQVANLNGWDTSTTYVVGAVTDPQCHINATLKSNGQVTNDRYVFDYNTRTVSPVAPTYSCPSNSTLSGTLCTCTAPMVENGAHTACEMPAACAWAAGLSYAAGMSTWSLERGKNHCYSGCAFAVDPAEPPSFGIKVDGVWYDEVRMGNLRGTGGVAANCGSGDAAATPTVQPPANPPTAPAQPSCPAGQTSVVQTGAPGTTGRVCVTPTESTTKKDTSGSTIDPAGAVTATNTTQTTICNSGGCTTTTNISVSSGGTTQTSSESISQTKEAFCAAKPADKNCAGAGSADGKNSGVGGLGDSPAVPDLYGQKYPDGLAGVWSTKKAALLATSVGSLTSTLMPSVPNGGSAPVWMLPLSFGNGWEFGSFDVAPPAYVWGWAKVFVLLGALLLARALIFGG